MTPTAESELEGIPAPGTILGGKLRILGVLGRGGMGVILEGQHLDLDEPVAIKLLKPSLLKEPDARERFLREARAAWGLQSRYATRIFDVGTSDDGIPYIVMERLEGDSLDRVLNARGPFELADAVRMVLQACEAVAEAHGRGIVHRDIKPANLFLTRQDGGDIVKVLDFGISKRIVGDLAIASMSLTAPDTLLGSPQYMSPEQLTTPARVDARTDVWALGVTLFELLTGELPFSAETIPGLYTHILTGATPRVRTLRPELPEAVDAVIGRCLEKASADRFASVTQLATALAPLGLSPPHGTGKTNASENHFDNERLGEAATEFDRAASSVVSTHRPKKVVLGVLVAGSIAAIAGAAWQWQRHARDVAEGITANAATELQPLPERATAPRSTEPSATGTTDAAASEAPAVATPAELATENTRPSPAPRPVGSASPATAPRVRKLSDIKPLD